MNQLAMCLLKHLHALDYISESVYEWVNVCVCVCVHICSW